jgi:hypothetical protein
MTVEFTSSLQNDLKGSFRELTSILSTAEERCFIRFKTEAETVSPVNACN